MGLKIKPINFISLMLIASNQNNKVKIKTIIEKFKINSGLKR